jgi:hypothetical protein
MYCFCSWLAGLLTLTSLGGISHSDALEHSAQPCNREALQLSIPADAYVLKRAWFFCDFPSLFAHPEANVGQPRINQQSLFVCVYRSLKRSLWDHSQEKQRALCAQTLDSVAS